MSPATVLVDGHVHFHSCFEEVAFLDAALDNFRDAAGGLGEPPDEAREWTGCLLLTESRGDDWFGRLRVATSPGRSAGPGPWRVRRTEEPDSLRLVRDDDSALIVVAGRQLVTSDGLEVLALASGRRWPDGMELVEAVRAVLDGGALAAVPWGFGKWWGARGALLEELLGSELGDDLFLGDNGGRPALAPRPRLFDLGAAAGVPVLAGTDPLPFPSHERRAGSYGFVLDGPIDLDRPAAAIREWSRRRRQPRSFGRRSGLLRCCGDQVAMQLRKRRAARPA